MTRILLTAFLPLAIGAAVLMAPQSATAATCGTVSVKAFGADEHKTAERAKTRLKWAINRWAWKHRTKHVGVGKKHAVCVPNKGLLPYKCTASAHVCKK